MHSRKKPVMTGTLLTGPAEFTAGPVFFIWTEYEIKTQMFMGKQHQTPTNMGRGLGEAGHQ